MQKFQEEIKLSDKQKKDLKKLVTYPEWDALQELVEQLLQYQAFSLISSNLSKDEKLEDLEDAEGGYFFWRRIKEFISHD